MPVLAPADQARVQKIRELRASPKWATIDDGAKAKIQSYLSGLVSQPDTSSLRTDGTPGPAFREEQDYTPPVPVVNAIGVPGTPNEFVGNNPVSAMPPAETTGGDILAGLNRGGPLVSQQVSGAMATAGQYIPGALGRRLTEYGTQGVDMAQGAIDQFPAPRTIAGQVAEATPGLLGAVGVGLATAGAGLPAVAGTLAGAGAVGAQTAGGTFVQTRDRLGGQGAPQELVDQAAAAQALPSGIFGAITGTLPIGRILGRVMPGASVPLGSAMERFASTPVGRRLVEAAVGGSQNAAQEVFNNALRIVAEDDPATADNILRGAGQAALMGGLMTAGTAEVVGALGGREQALPASTPEVEATTRAGTPGVPPPPAETGTPAGVSGPAEARDGIVPVTSAEALDAARAIRERQAALQNESGQEAPATTPRVSPPEPVSETPLVPSPSSEAESVPQIDRVSTASPDLTPAEVADSTPIPVGSRSRESGERAFPSSPPTDSASKATPREPSTVLADQSDTTDRQTVNRPAEAGATESAPGSVSSLDSMTPAQLRREAKTRGVDSRGTKAQLLERLRAAEQPGTPPESDIQSRSPSQQAKDSAPVSALEAEAPRSDTLRTQDMTAQTQPRPGSVELARPETSDSGRSIDAANTKAPSERSQDIRPSSASADPTPATGAKEPSDGADLFERSHRLRTPIKGKNGAEIVGYRWMSQMEEGMFRDRRVSDWSKAQTSAPTGRQIVHLYLVKTADGTETLMGVGAAKKALGISEERLYAIAKREADVQRINKEQWDRQEKRYQSLAAKSPDEASQTYKAANDPNKMMWGTREQHVAKAEELLAKSTLLEKDGRFIRTGDSETIQELKTRGWTDFQSAPKLAKAAPDPSPAAAPGKRAVSGSEGGGEKARKYTQIPKDWHGASLYAWNNANEVQLAKGKRLPAESRGAVRPMRSMPKAYRDSLGTVPTDATRLIDWIKSKTPEVWKLEGTAGRGKTLVPLELIDAAKEAVPDWQADVSAAQARRQARRDLIEKNRATKAQQKILDEARTWSADEWDEYEANNPAAARELADMLDQQDISNGKETPDFAADIIDDAAKRARGEIVDEGIEEAGSDASAGQRNSGRDVGAEAGRAKPWLQQVSDTPPPFEPKAKEQTRGVFGQEGVEPLTGGQRGMFGDIRADAIPDPSSDLPGIRPGESVAAYHKRMGTADTPEMFGEKKPTTADRVVAKPPMNARRGAIINPFFPEPPREPAHKISDPDIDARWRQAKQGVGKASVRDIVAGALNTVVKGTMRGSLPELPRTEQFGEARSAARAMRDAKAIGQDAAERAIAPIIKDMSPDEYDLFSQRVVFADLAKTDGKLPFGLRDKDHAKTELERIDAAVAKSPKVQAALKRRAETMQGIKDEYIKAFAPLGVDMSKRLNREDYYRHQVLMYAQERARQAVGAGPGKPVTTPTNRGFLKGREGSSLDINANYVQAEFEVMAQMVADTKMANAIERIRKTYDIRPELVEKAKEEGKEVSDIIPDTHTEYAIRPGKTMFSVYTVPEKYAAEALLNGATELNVPIEKVRTALAVGSDFTPLIVPKEVAAQLEALAPDTKTPNFFTKAWQGSLGAWKQYQLHSPQRVIKYSLRNLTEVDKVMSMAPGSILRVPEAVRDLVKLYRRAEDTPQSIRDWAERSGSSLVRVNEIGDVPAMERFAKVLEDKTGTTPAGQAAKLPLKAWSGYWKAAGIANDMRESILRYASYLHFVDQMKASKDGLPSGFAASNKNEIRGIKDIRDRAYRLSADMLGDYGDISPAGDFLRKNIYPFWSFQEVNFRAYMKGVQNLANDTVTAMRAGRSFATAAGVGRIGAMSAIQIGKLALLLGGFRAITQTINRLMFPDEEKKLPPELRRQSHIILGTDSDGKIRYFNRLGTSGDFLEWFGADAADEDLRDLLNGRRTLGQIASDYAKSPINKLVQGVGPHVKIPMELAYGKSLYPDFTKPRSLNPTNDKAEYLASQLGLDTAYKWAAGMPLPKDAAQKAVSSSFLYRLDPDQAAYYRIRDEVARFKSSKGMSRSSEGAEGERANALRNLKLSLRYKDEDAAARFLAQYAALGGSSDGLKSSLMAMNPLSGLSEAQRGEFQSKWLRTEDKPFLDAANKYYKDVLIGDPSAMSRAVQKAQPLIAAEVKKREAQK